MSWQALVNPSYVGGDIKTDFVLSGSAGSEESYSLMGFTYRYPESNAQALMIPFSANSKVAAGRMESLHAGLPASGAYWFVPDMSAGSALTGSSHALRLRCLAPLYVTRAAIEVTTNQSGSAATIKIYASNEGTTPLWTSNGIATTSNALLASSATNPGVWLNPGYNYIIEYSNTNALVAVNAATLPAAHLNQGSAQRGTTAANIVAGTSTNTNGFPRIKLF